jgi:SIR2-like domain
MAPNMIRKIAYLFGAGATHAELLALDPDLESKEGGLLISDLSKRVMLKASRDPDYINDLKIVSGTGGSLNIELLISLIENSKIPDWSKKTDILKNLIRDDIRSALSPSRTKRFSLHKGLLEFHQHHKTRTKEKLIGLISLNYDDVLDKAYTAVIGNGINYCFSREMDSQAPAKIPLLKLHGSFNWNNRLVLCKRRKIEIIPLGSSKSYLHAPYGFIWNRALDLLTRCDSLRVIGCSLSPNDVHLIDLLFKAQLERHKPFNLEIIALDQAADTIKGNYGFFRKITRLSDLGVPSTPVTGPLNPFKTWLRYTAADLFSKREMNAMPYLRTVTT